MALEIMDKIHNSEGRVHEVSKIALSDIDKYLINKGFRIEKHKSNFQKVLIVYR